MSEYQNVIIQIDIEAGKCPFFGLWKWGERDFDCPLIFYTENIKASLFLVDKFGKHSSAKKYADLNICPEAKLVIEVNNPTSSFVIGLRSKSGNNTLEVANKVYSIYLSVIKKFEILLRTVGDIKHLPELRVSSIESLFERDRLINRSNVSYKIDNEDFKPFQPIVSKPSRGRNPLFKKEELITTEKWKKMQKIIDNDEFVKQEILELLKIRSRLFWRENKTATLEAAILLETLLRDYSVKILKKRGISNTKIKQLQDELTFNNVLNLVLPLTLSKVQINKLTPSILAVDALRKVRNSLIHGEIKEEDVDASIIEKGIDGGFKIIKHLII